MGKAQTVSELPKKRFNTLLGILKNEYHINQNRLGKEIPLTPQYISDLKHGNNNIIPSTANGICDAVTKLTKGKLNVSAQWLLGYDDFKNETERLEWKIKNDLEKKEREERHRMTVERIRANAAKKIEAVHHIYALLDFMGYTIESVYIANWDDMLNALQNVPGRYKPYMPHNIEQYNSLREWFEEERPSPNEFSQALNFIGDSYAGVMYRITTPSGATKTICRDDFSAMIVGIKNTAAALIESGIERTGLHCFLSPVVVDDVPINEFPAYPNMMN